VDTAIIAHKKIKTICNFTFSSFFEEFIILTKLISKHFGKTEGFIGLYEFFRSIICLFFLARKISCRFRTKYF